MQVRESLNHFLCTSDTNCLGSFVCVCVCFFLFFCGGGGVVVHTSALCMSDILTYSMILIKRKMSTVWYIWDMSDFKQSSPSERCSTKILQPLLSYVSVYSWCKNKVLLICKMLLSVSLFWDLFNCIFTWIERSPRIAQLKNVQDFLTFKWIFLYTKQKKPLNPDLIYCRQWHVICFQQKQHEFNAFKAEILMT